jgi:hypothetical protein
MTVNSVGMLQRKGLNKLKRELLIPKPNHVKSPIDNSPVVVSHPVALRTFALRTT